MDNSKNDKTLDNLITNNNAKQQVESHLSSSIISPLYGKDENKKTTTGISYHSDKDNSNSKDIFKKYIASNIILPTKKHESKTIDFQQKYKPNKSVQHNEHEHTDMLKPRSHNDNIFGENTAKINRQLNEIKDKFSRNKINQNVIQYEQASFFDENKNLNRYKDIDAKFRYIMDEIYQNKLNNTSEIVEKINDDHFFNQ